MSEDIPLAAEHALRLLEGEELMEARRRVSIDRAFAAEVAWWEDQFAPLFEDIADEPAPADVWQRIIERLDGPAPALLSIKRQLKRWQAATGVAAAAAAILLAVQLRPPPTPPLPRPEQARPAPLLVAGLSGEEAPETLSVAFRPDSRLLVITPLRIALDAGRARQLWLIPAGGQPISLGLIAPEGVQRRVIPAATAARFAEGATIAVSDEPTGGSPTGQPTGAVLATGGLSAV
nr:anti-sigma factor [uncultured Sphingomonas sp.]